MAKTSAAKERPKKEEDEEVADPPAAVRPEDDVEMTFFEHLTELRKRLVRALIGLVPGMVVGWIYRVELFEFLARPFIRASAMMPETLSDNGLPRLTVTTATEALGNNMMIAAIVGLLIASPWVFYQVWAFIAPGLYRRERRLALPFILSSTLFFVGGVAFCYYLVLEPSFVMFLQYSHDTPNIQIVENITITEYFDLATKFMLAFGITFEMPVVIAFLSMAGIVNWRQLLRFARWWLLISGILAAVLSPGADVGMQLMMLAPLNVLYWFSILVSAILGPKAPKPEKPKVVEGPEEEEEES